MVGSFCRNIFVNLELFNLQKNRLRINLVLDWQTSKVLKFQEGYI